MKDTLALTSYDQLTYRIIGCPVALLINFGTRSLQWRRIFPTKKIREHRVNRQWLFVPDWLRDKALYKGCQLRKITLRRYSE